MISDRTRKEVWNELLDIDHACRYYEAVHARASRRYLGVRALVLMSIAGSIVAILDLLPGPTVVYQILFAALVAALTVWEAVSNYAKRAAAAHTIYTNSSLVRTQLRELWLMVDDESADEMDVRHRVQGLALTRAGIGNLAGASDLIPDEKLNEKVTKDAYAFVSSRYSS